MISLEPFAEDVWIVNGPTVRAVGIPFPTRMIVVRLGSRSWWVNSPVSAPRELLDGMTAEGPVKFLVAPTKLHSRLHPAFSPFGLPVDLIASHAF